MRVFVVVVLLLSFGSLFAQNTWIAGDFKSTTYSSMCPNFHFAPDGVVSAAWSDTYGALDMSLVEREIAPVKENLESLLKAYSGQEFFDKLEFKGVDISYYDSIAKFDGRYPPVDMYRCKAKYFFYYYFIPYPNLKYCIGIALDDNQQIISEFNFPSKEFYLPLDETLNSDQLLKIVKDSQTPMQPIESISLEYNPERQFFYWQVKQGIVNPKPGENERNEVTIEASDAKQVVSYMKVVLLDKNGKPVYKADK